MLVRAAGRWSMQDCGSQLVEPVLACTPVLHLTLNLLYHVHTLSFIISHPCLTHNLLYHTYPLISHNLITHLHFRSSILYLILRFGISIIRRISRIQFLCDTDTEHASACNPVLNSSIWFTLHLIPIQHHNKIQNLHDT